MDAQGARGRAVSSQHELHRPRKVWIGLTEYISGLLCVIEIGADAMHINKTTYQPPMESEPIEMVPKVAAGIHAAPN